MACQGLGLDVLQCVGCAVGIEQVHQQRHANPTSEQASLDASRAQLNQAVRQRAPYGSGGSPRGCGNRAGCGIGTGCNRIGCALANRQDQLIPVHASLAFVAQRNSQNGHFQGNQRRVSRQAVNVKLDLVQDFRGTLKHKHTRFRLSHCSATQRVDAILQLIAQLGFLRNRHSKSLF